MKTSGERKITAAAMRRLWSATATRKRRRRTFAGGLRRTRVGDCAGAVALFSFLFCFNDFFGPLLYTGESPDNWTLSVGLAQFRTIHQVQWNLTMAATVVVMAPVVLLFFLAQRAFVEGVTLTGVKG